MDHLKKKEFNKLSLGGWGWSYGPMGYFHLYNNSYLYEEGDSASHIDQYFYTKNFNKYCMIDSYVLHLGPPDNPNYNNHKGKIINFDGKDILLKDLKYSCKIPTKNTYKNMDNQIISTTNLK